MKPKSLTYTSETEVKFHEVDSLGMVWHGHYIRYFEDGREAFGKAYDIDYLTIYQNKLVTPIVNINCDYKRFLRYGDKVTIETEYVPCDAAKINFNYRLTNSSSGEVVVVGSTSQVFLNSESLLLQLTNPPFFEAWKKKHLFT